MRWQGPDGYWAGDDMTLVDAARVHAWMSKESYWAAGRARRGHGPRLREFPGRGPVSAAGEQAGFARLVTDYATVAWLCDVFAAAGHRGHGIGTFLVETAVGHPDVREVRQVVMAEPGSSIYR
jgi:GNAT superfamily N-acetyltransferase